MSNVKRKGNSQQMERKLVIGGLKGIAAWGDLVAQRASLKAPVITTNLATSIFASTPTYVPPVMFTILVGTNVEYARAQEMGSGLHSTGPNARKEKYEIWAGGLNPKGATSSKMALAFPWPGGPTGHPAYDPESGKFLFAKIMHPGVRPQPYLMPALIETRKEGQELFLKALQAELAR